ncbi:MAG: class A beta-lactamase-related serine hydrolase [Clostridiales bacterium]|jgi:beta-lactamase class A|nr:class A beta-lactamase-related serine hydrolase [Clostridiales bacterium]
MDDIINAMNKEILSLIAAESGEAGVLCQRIGDKAPFVSVAAGRRFTSASVIKAAVLLTLLEYARLGRLSLEDTLQVRQADILPDSVPFEHGPRAAALRELAVWMITVSDNTATNVLIDALGMDAVNGYCAKLGMRQTALRRKMLDFEARAAGRDNTTSPEDMFLLFERLFAGDILTPRLRGEAIDILRRVRDGEKFRRYIWESIPIAHKTGGLEGVSHDAGVFSFEAGDVYVGVFVEHSGAAEGSPRLIGRVARMVCDCFTRRG